MKKALFLVLLAVLVITPLLAQTHGWVQKDSKTQTELAVTPYGTALDWCDHAFLFPNSWNGKGNICLRATAMESGATTVTKPQVVCKLVGPDGITVFGDSANSYFTITNVDTVNRPSGTTFNYAIPFDVSRYGNAYGLLIGFKGFVAACSTKMDVLGVRY